TAGSPQRRQRIPRLGRFSAVFHKYATLERRARGEILGLFFSAASAASAFERDVFTISEGLSQLAWEKRFSSRIRLRRLSATTPRRANRRGADGRLDVRGRRNR